MENVGENMKPTRFGYPGKSKAYGTPVKPQSAQKLPSSGVKSARRSLDPSEMAVAAPLRIQEVINGLFPEDVITEISKLKPKLVKYQSYKDQIKTMNETVAKYKSLTAQLFIKKDESVKRLLEIEATFNSQIQEVRESQESTLRKRRRIEEQMEDFETKHQVLLSEMAEDKTKLASMKQTLVQLESENKDLQDRNLALQQETSRDQIKIQERDSKLESQQQQQQQQSRHLQETEAKVQELQEELKEERQRCKEAYSQKSDVQNQSRQLQDDLKRALDERVQLRAELDKSLGELREHQRSSEYQSGNLQKDLDRIAAEKQGWLAERDSMQKKASEWSQERERQSQEILQLKSDFQESKSNLQHEIKKKELEVESLRRELESSAARSKAIQEQQCSLEKKLESQELLQRDRDAELSRLREELRARDQTITSFSTEKQYREENFAREREMLLQMNEKLDDDLKSLKEALQAKQEEIHRKDESILSLRSEKQERDHAFNEQLGQSNFRYKALESEFESYKQRLEQTIQELKLQQRSQIEALEQQSRSGSNSMKELLSASEAKMEQLKAEKHKLEESLSSQSSQKQQLEIQLVHLQSERKQLELQMDRLSEEKSKLNEQLNNVTDSMNKTVSNLSQAQEYHQKTVDEFNQEKSSLQDTIRSIQSEKESLSRDRLNALEELKELKKSHSALQVQHLQLSEKHTELQTLSMQTDMKYQLLVQSHAQLEADFSRVSQEYSQEKKQWELIRNAMIQEHKDLLTKYDDEKVQWQATVGGMQAEHNTTVNEFSLCQQKLSLTELELSQVKAMAGSSEEQKMNQICNLTKELELMRRECSDKADLIMKIGRSEDQIRDLQKALFDNEILRRKLHNDIQDLKGNIRVICRVRPLLPSDNASDNVIDFGSNETDMALVDTRGRTQKYSYDHVFTPNHSQSDIYEEVSQLIQSALDGYNVCLFTYGQTGSGKTYTIQGLPYGDGRGIIPRAIEKILDQAAYLEGLGWHYTMEVSYLEIYNEKTQDLLAEKDPGQDLPIKKDVLFVACLHSWQANKRTYIEGLTRINVDSKGAIKSLMARAERNRSVACTAMNERSSRSHSVFTLFLRGENKSQKTVLEGALNLCDLAGSERLSRSEATGSTLNETKHINKSLSALAGVFMAISNKEPHIPFRDSKLTYLLQPCLSGDGKTMMIVNVSPTPESLGETVCSLRFASQVNSCEIGRAKKVIQKTGGPDGK